MLDLSNKYVLAGIALGAIALGAAIYIYITKYRSKSSFNASPDREGEMVNKKIPLPGAPVEEAPVFVFFYATWCPHCEQMMDEWRQTEQALLGKINTKAIESENPEIAKHKFPGFPTLRMFPGGLNHPESFVDYRGPRKADAMIKFVMDGPEQ